MNYIKSIFLSLFFISFTHTQDQMHDLSFYSDACNAYLAQMSKKPMREYEKDHLIFTNFVGIIINFIKLLTDPHNIPEAKNTAKNILNGIYNLAHVITRSPMSPELQEQLIQELMKCAVMYHAQIYNEGICEVL